MRALGGEGACNGDPPPAAALNALKLPLSMDVRCVGATREESGWRCVSAVTFGAPPATGLRTGKRSSAALGTLWRLAGRSVSANQTGALAPGERHARPNGPIGSGESPEGTARLKSGRHGRGRGRPCCCCGGANARRRWPTMSPLEGLCNITHSWLFLSKFGNNTHNNGKLCFESTTREDTEWVEGKGHETNNSRAEPTTR